MTPIQPDIEWISVPEAARRVHVTPRTIWHWKAAGRLTTKKTVTGHTRIAAYSLWEESPTVPPVLPDPEERAIGEEDA